MPRHTWKNTIIKVNITMEFPLLWPSSRGYTLYSILVKSHETSLHFNAVIRGSMGFLVFIELSKTYFSTWPLELLVDKQYILLCECRNCILIQLLYIYFLWFSLHVHIDENCTHETSLLVRQECPWACVVRVCDRNAETREKIDRNR